MASLNAKDVYWKPIEVLGKKGLFTNVRVDKDTIPKGYYVYEMRHADNDWCEPVEIGLGILVNFFGTLLVKEPLGLISVSWTNNAYLDITENDWNYLGGIVIFESMES